jgi:putative transposase
MPYNPDIHHRQAIRLKNYDYSQSGAYFITICTKQKQCIFGDIKNGKMRFNVLGAIAGKYWQEIPEHFPNVALDVYTIMPNHLHGILWIIESSENGNKNRKFGDIVVGSISSVVRSYKAIVSKKINQICHKKGLSVVWQSRYHEKIIRDEKALVNIRSYIMNNPLNWDMDEENPKIDEYQPDILLDLPF